MNVVLWIILGILGIIVLYLLFLVLVSLFVNPAVEYNKNSRFYRGVVNFLTALILFFTNTRTRVEGMELLPKDKRFLLVCNHRSNFDPLITWLKLKKYDLAFISKPENLKIPVVGKLVQKCCFMAIDRENPRNAVKTINRAVDLIRADEVSVGVYPEGTRSKDCVLLPFHNAVFKIALKADCDIAVATIVNTEQIHKNAPFKKTDVNLTIHKVISSEQIKGKKTNEIGEEVLEIIKNNL